MAFWIQSNTILMKLGLYEPKHPNAKSKCRILFLQCAIFYLWNVESFSYITSTKQIYIPFPVSSQSITCLPFETSRESSPQCTASRPWNGGRFFSTSTSKSSKTKHIFHLSLESSSSSSSPPPISSRTNRDAAISALHKLAKRQNDDLQETINLLQRLSVFDDSNDQGRNQTIELNDTFTATAASLLSGVDYGFVSRSEGASPSILLPLSNSDESDIPAKRQSYGPPANLFRVGSEQFFRNFKAMQGEYNDEKQLQLTSSQLDLQGRLKQLTLTTSAIWDREKENGPVTAPWILQVPYYALCFILDSVFEGKYAFSRFFLLETVARMPYFSYIAMLHFYETVGFWRRSSDIKRIHFAEELNEYRHLLIQESLGGDQQWIVRFLAQHSAIVYFYVLCFLWILSPTLSYKFSEMLETHAVHTYGQFLDENESVLKELPPSFAAVEYYTFGASDPFYAEFQTSALNAGKELRRPGSHMNSLYDVFKAIQADELDHVNTMQACLDPNIVLRSASVEKQVLFGLVLVSATATTMSTGAVFDPTTLATDIVLDDITLAAIESTIATGASLLTKFVAEGGFSGSGLSGDTEFFDTGLLMWEVDIIGAIGIFLVGVRKFFADVVQLMVKFFSVLFFPKK